MAMKRLHTISQAAPLLLSLLLAAGCGPDGLDAEERTQLQGMAVAGPVENLPSPSNAFADDPDAAALGQALFFDARMSSDGTVACATCHDPRRAFSDPDPTSAGVGGQRGDRHAPAIVNPGAQRLFLWDGRADSLWSQALMAIENPVEMNLTRLEVARFIAATYAAPYEAVFGPLPDLAALPQRGKPGDDAWEQLSDDERYEVERVFTNVGKALEAYQRRLSCSDTRFDQAARGEIAFSDVEERGAAAFLRAGCADCHSGPQLHTAPDQTLFHNLGIAQGDPGRQAGAQTLQANPFNGAGDYSDDPEAGALLLVGLEEGPATAGAFKTPSLRGVAQRPRFFHDGSRASLADVLDFYRTNGGGRRRRGGGGGGAAPGVDADLRDLGNFDPREVGAFLSMLDCAPPPAALLNPRPELPR